MTARPIKRALTELLEVKEFSTNNCDPERHMCEKSVEDADYEQDYPPKAVPASVSFVN
jgi:hypothetical protein